MGSYIVHVGIPDSNLNQLTVDQLAQGPALLKTSPNPYYGEIPVSSSIGVKTITQAQLIKPYPRFLNVVIYRHNSSETNYNAVEAEVEDRLAHGVSFLFAYTHSKLIDDASFECDRLPAVGNASDGDAGYQLQFFRRLPTSAPQHSWQARAFSRREEPGALLQHRRVCHGTAVHDWFCVAQPGARACLSGPGSREAHDGVARRRPGVPRRTIQRDEHAGLWPAERELRLGGLWEHYQHNDRSQGDAACNSIEPVTGQSAADSRAKFAQSFIPWCTQLPRCDEGGRVARPRSAGSRPRRRG